MKLAGMIALGASALGLYLACIVVLYRTRGE